MAAEKLRGTGIRIFVCPGNDDEMEVDEVIRRSDLVELGEHQCYIRLSSGGERLPTVAELQEVQRRLTALGFDTDGTDGRAGRDTMRAVRAFQKKVGMDPADGYPGIKLLARLRQGA